MRYAPINGQSVIQAPRTHLSSRSIPIVYGGTWCGTQWRGHLRSWQWLDTRDDTSVGRRPTQPMRSQGQIHIKSTWIGGKRSGRMSWRTSWWSCWRSVSWCPSPTRIWTDRPDWNTYVGLYSWVLSYPGSVAHPSSLRYRWSVVRGGNCWEPWWWGHNSWGRWGRGSPKDRGDRNGFKGK